MRIAVVGTGIAGLGAAYALSRAHEVELFERDERPGGHTNTVAHDGLALDTGFIVHNAQNYPKLTRLFGELGVPDAGVRDVVLGPLRAARARVRRAPAAGRAPLGSSARSPASCARSRGTIAGARGADRGARRTSRARLLARSSATTSSCR